MRLLAAVVLLTVLIATPAVAAERVETTVAKPSGKAPMRYRDEVFPRVDVARDVPYTSTTDAQGKRLTLDRYTPAGDRERDRPAVVWVHGGGFVAGTKAAVNVAELARRFARAGYVAVSIDYRLLNAQRGCGQTGATADCVNAVTMAVADSRDAVAWLREHSRRLRIDPDRIAIGGTSAGAVTSQLVGLGGRASHVRAAIAISGGLPGDPVPQPGAVPTLFFQGTADRTTPYDRARANATKLAAANVPVTFETLQDAGHVPFVQYGERFFRHSAYFLHEHLAL